MIVHTLDTDTVISFDWDDDAGDNITVTEATLLVDDEDATDDLITINGTYSITLAIADDYEITAGNHTYKLTADDGTTITVISAGLLRVRP